MISCVKGKIIHRGKNFIIIKTGNIGYKVFVLPHLNLDVDEVELFTHLNVREDSLSLYGFSSYTELELFELLISVSGIGPKSGMGVLSIASAETIKVAIANGDVGILTRVSGIGKKTAERIVLELRNKFSISSQDGLEEKVKEINDQTDVIEALIGLGYNPAQAKRALEKVSPKIKDVGERIKMALKELGRK